MIPKDKSVIHGLLIAAGSSSRLGRPKQLVNYKGKHLINHAIDQLVNSDLNELKIVLGCNSELIIPLIDTRINVVINEKWESGMGSSISLGIEQLSYDVDAILVSLVDQYNMTSSVINSLINEFNNNPEKLIVSQYSNGIYGPPAIFPRRLFDDLKVLEGDRGAGKSIKSELANNPDQVIVVNFEKGHLDIDTPEDLLNLQE